MSLSAPAKPTHTNPTDVEVKHAHTVLTEALNQLVQHIDLTYAQMDAVMQAIMQGECHEATMGAILTSLRMKGESIEEITAAASVMRRLATTIAPQRCEHLVDIVGTGGDGANLFNVSTASALVAAAAGAQVAKHGNRGVSSKSGSSDLLEAAGIRLDLTPQQSLACIEQHGIGFLFAPNHHQAMQHAVGVRRALKTRTLFNILGPLTNPANVPHLVIGVFTPALCEPLAHVMHNLGAKHVMVVGASDGLDEISLAAPTHVAELKHGTVSTYTLTPEDVGVESQTLIGLSVSDAKASFALIQAALSGQTNQPTYVHKARDMIALNAGAAIYVAGLVSDLTEGVALAKTIIIDGRAWQKMTDLARFSQQLAQPNKP